MKTEFHFKLSFSKKIDFFPFDFFYNRIDFLPEIKSIYGKLIYSNKSPSLLHERLKLMDQSESEELKCWGVKISRAFANTDRVPTPNWQHCIGFLVIEEPSHTVAVLHDKWIAQHQRASRNHKKLEKVFFASFCFGIVVETP